MKRIFSITISMLIFYSAYSQSLIVTGSNFVPTTDACLQTHSSLTVKNISSDTLNVLCQKVIIDTTLGTDNNFCWGANCYGVTTYISTDYNELLPGEGDNIDFAGYYDAYCYPASAVIEYCFYPESDPTDRACITLTYNESSTSVSQLKSVIVSDFYPNPASEMVYFTFNGNAATLKLIDILGNNVKEILLSQEGIQKLDLSDMNKGIYFGNLIVNDEVVSIKKLIVK
jgi:hypothetical protein